MYWNKDYDCKSAWDAGWIVTLDVLKCLNKIMIETIQVRLNSNIRCIEIRLYCVDVPLLSGWIVTLDVLK